MHPEKKSKNHLFPIFVKMESKRLLIVGGGNVALEKLTALITNSPNTNVTLVAKQIRKDVLDLILQFPHHAYHERSYETNDLFHQDFVIGATDDQELHKRIKAEANQHGILVNIADTPELCDFYLSSVVHKGNIKIAISSNGLSPTIAKRLKEVLQENLPHEVDDLTENLHVLRQKLKGDFAYKVKKLNKITQRLVTKEDTSTTWKRNISYLLLIFGAMLFGHILFSYIPIAEIYRQTTQLYANINPNLWQFVLVGLVAQMVDGILGMGYGVTSSIILLSLGINPIAVSGSIHTAEIFSTAASGYSHYRFGNVNKKLFKVLALPGIAGAITGCIILIWIGTLYGKWLRIILACYVLFLGIKFFINAFRKETKKKKFKRYGLLAFGGGFCDAFGGGGWGPLVTTTLIEKGRTPKYVIGSVSLTEFFVTFSSAIILFYAIGIQYWDIVIAIIIGSVIAAPFAAKLAGKISRKLSFILLGIIIMIWSGRILYSLFG